MLSASSGTTSKQTALSPPEKRPRITIGVPVRNGSRFLAATLESLLCQTYSDFELLISDNASTDDTGMICVSYARADSRVRYHRHEKNIGLAGNYNHLVTTAQGEYFKWAAGDDLCEPRYLERCLEILESHPDVVLSYPQTRFVDDAGGPLAYSDPGFDLQSVLPEERLRYVIFAGHWVNAIFGLIRTQILRQTRLLPHYSGGDYALLGELAVRGRFVEVPEALFLRRVHADASSQNTHNPGLLAFMWTGRNSVSFPYWNRTFDHLKTILSADISSAQKCSLLLSLGRIALSNRRPLLSEAAQVFSLR